MNYRTAIALSRDPAAVPTDSLERARDELAKLHRARSDAPSRQALRRIGRELQTRAEDWRSPSATTARMDPRIVADDQGAPDDPR